MKDFKITKKNPMLGKFSQTKKQEKTEEKLDYERSHGTGYQLIPIGDFHLLGHYFTPLLLHLILGTSTLLRSNDSINFTFVFFLICIQFNVRIE